MTFDFTTLRNTLSNWPDPLPPDNATDALLKRIKATLSSVQTIGQGFADLIPLLRQALLRESAVRKRNIELKVPNSPGWPNTDVLHSFGFRILERGPTHYLVSAMEWNPEWLDPSSGGVFSDAFAEKRVRSETRVNADPFLFDITGFDTYSCPGQCEAVRAALLMNPGETLIVNLPTGSGKSLVAQAPALMAKEGHLTLFVVPTIALAFDQARQMEKLLKAQGKHVPPMVWHGGLSLDDRKNIRNAVRSGSQGILFTSPEALTRGLLSAVFHAASAGMLRYFVVDEAHLITQWGDSFRPAFQTLAGLRRGLLRATGHQPFRTLLLSATLTEETVETLSTMFGEEGLVEMVSAVHLRPEPQYWRNRAESSIQKHDRILEAIRHAPRPFLLYLTTPAEAQDWYNTLRDSGLSRIASFHGQTPSKERKRIIKEWAQDELDGVVATSAFGVGVDKADVRCVIHASVPETLDRFYQEVGRGGRDGASSASLLVFHNQEQHARDKLAAPTLITDELGINRWEAMYEQRKQLSGQDLVELNLGVVPEHGRQSSDFNTAWNMRTLLLMERSNLLQLDLQPPVSDENDDTLPHEKVTVRILHDGHQRESTWEELVKPSRARTVNAAQKNVDSLHDWLNEKVEISATLKKIYSIKSNKWATDVVGVCGGCPEHRMQRKMSADIPTYRIPQTNPISRALTPNLEAWKNALPWLDPVCVTVFYEQNDAAGIKKFLEWLIASCGFQEVVISEDHPLIEDPGIRQLYRRASTGVVVHRTLQSNIADDAPIPLARVSLLAESSAGEEYRAVSALVRPYHVILAPSSTPDSARSQRKLCDILSNSVSLEQLLPVISR